MNDEMKKGVRRAAKALRQVADRAAQSPPLAIIGASVAEAVPDELYMTELEMMGLELHTARIEVNAAVRDKLAAQEQLLMIEYQSKRDTIRKQRVEAEVSIERIKSDYNGLRERIQQRLGVQLEEYLVQETGRLVPAPVDN
jgi:hypothetical protein